MINSGDSCFRHDQYLRLILSYSAVRGKIGAVIEQWQKICLLSERLIKRREAAAVRNPHALFRRKFLPSLLTPSVPSLPTSSAASMTSSPPASPRSLASSVLPVLPSVTVFGSFAAAPLVGSARPDGAADGGYYTSYFEDPQADMSRLTITLNALNEVNAQCWRGEGPDGCELCSGVRQGLEQVSSHVAKQSEDLDNRVSWIFVVKDAMILICYVLGSCHVNHNT